MAHRIKLKSNIEIKRAITGDTNQNPTIRKTPGHRTTSTRPVATPNPINAPIIECVVDTGIPKDEAVNNHMEAPINAERFPYISKSGRPVKASKSKFVRNNKLLKCSTIRKLS